MLLKIDLLFVISYNILITPFVLYMYITLFDSFTVGQKVVVFGSIAILILVVFFQALAYKSVKMEYINMLYILKCFLILLIKFSINRLKENGKLE